MSILRKKDKPADLTAKMPLRLDKDGDILVTSDGVEGYIEFWADDALAIKSRLGQIQNEFHRYFLIQQKRSEKDLQKLSLTVLANEVETLKQLNIDALSMRVKSWLLVDDCGDVVHDKPLTMENARDLFSDDDFRAYANDWLENSKNAFLPTKSES